MTTQHLFNRLNNKQLTEIIREHNLDSEIKPYYHKPNNFIVNKLLEHLTIDNSGFIVIKEHNVIVKPNPEGKFKEKSEEEKIVKKQVRRQKSKEYREKKKQEKKEEEENKKKEKPNRIDESNRIRKEKEEKMNEEARKEGERLKKMRDERDEEIRKEKENERFEKEWKEEEEKERRKRYFKKNEAEIFERENQKEEEEREKNKQKERLRKQRQQNQDRRDKEEEEKKKKEEPKEDPKIKYINDNKKKIIDLYETKKKALAQKYYNLQRELFDIRKPYVKEAERKEKDKGLKITQQRFNTIIKNVSKNIQEVKTFNEKVEKYGEKSQEFINDFTPIKRKLTFNNSPFTSDEIEFIYKNILNDEIEEKKIIEDEFKKKEIKFKIKEINSEIEKKIKMLKKYNSIESQKELKILIDKQNKLIDKLNEMK